MTDHDLVERLESGDCCWDNNQDAANHIKALYDRIEQLEAELAQCKAEYARSICKYEGRIERLEGDIQILKLQRDATHISRCPRCNAEDRE